MALEKALKRSRTEDEGAIARWLMTAANNNQVIQSDLVVAQNC